ncbi:DEAD/DEAH box helicase [Actinoplanes sp. TBRC 11911]|uniref:DEAD/DEAH box helicase n=1 Tax=Actinoplanes sp. TBRC 11911 TaxID=2729386 RepID=UPI00145D84EF|nr:DEAD/DEAH box helicase [Actinoplanes sp. TBRC 11911]NMO49958.1 DEAD/DEAH box helicase [Actinoplanes sp. TBRC 11911]
MNPDPLESESGFAGLGLRAELLKALSTLGYEEPTPIQQEAIPPLVAGHDLVGQAATGTGKTAAFALPVLQGLTPGGRDSGPAALVLVPTRELAEQVSQAVHRYGRDLGVRVLPVYGGQPIGRQLQALARGVDVVVGTPGRVLDHIERATLRLGDVRTVVLDEADEMLDMGFAEDIEAILAETPDERQTVLFSATMPPRIDSIARRHLRNPVRITMGRKPVAPGDIPLVRQSAYMVARAHRPAALGRILDVEAPTAAIVFCRTREEVDQVTETLNGRGYRAEALHGGMSQDQRDRVMGRLRNGSTELLVATDVAARGLDVEQLTHVINFNVPAAPEAYVHRIGRVGRAGREGSAITLAEPREQRMLKAIERLTGQRITLEKLPTVTDLRARRLELTRTALQASLETDDLERFRVVLDSLTDEFDVENVALAAIKLLHEAAGGDIEEEEIPSPTAPRRERETRPPRGGGQRDRPDDGVTRLFFGIGRRAGLRPQDLVGAIAGESGLSAREIGAIQITDRFSLVEVPEPAADMVIAAMQRSTIRGRRPTVRRERFVR